MALSRDATLRLGLPGGIRACLFDLDGVLTRTAEIHARAWKQAFDEELARLPGLRADQAAPFDLVRDYERYVDGKPRADGARSFLRARGIDLPEGGDDEPGDHTVRAIARRKDRLFVRLLGAAPAATFAGSVRYLRAARAAGLRTAVVSSSKHCRMVVASARIADLFDAEIDGVVAAARRLAGKPAPDTYLAAASALGVTPAEAAVFEDALAGVVAGRAGGFGFVVGVDRLHQADALREHGANVVVDDLSVLIAQEAP